MLGYFFPNHRWPNISQRLVHFRLNRPFPSSKKSHLQNEAKCETFVVKISFICIIIKNHFHINGLALGLALKVRFFGTRKWSILSHLLYVKHWQYSRLSLNGHLYKTDTSLKRTPRVGPCLSLLPLLTLYKTDISLRGTLTAGPKGVCLRGSWLYSPWNVLVMEVSIVRFNLEKLA